jgi:energy-coupling factor transporter ATP-binding protein EcfA2
LQGVSFDLPPGGCLLVVGPSGSGKSSLALAIAGLIPRDIPGEVLGGLTVDGLDPRSAEPGAVAATVGLLFQDPGWQLVMDRVEDDVAFGLENRGWPRPAMARRVPEVIGDVGLGGLERRRSNRLSGGQRQRLALAGVLAPRPGILVLDEPTANLDPAGAAAFFERLALLRSQRPTTIVLIEHRVELAWPLADLVLALDRTGAPIDVGPPAEVLARSGATMTGAGMWMPGDDGGRRRSTAASVAADSVAAGSTAPRGSALVRATRLGFAYEAGSPVLSGVDFELFAGERIGLVGPNGSGKSTLGRLLVGLLRPTSGAVSLGGHDPARLAARQLARHAGYVFQDPEAGFLTDSVADEVLLGLPVGERPTAAALMERLGLPLDVFEARSPYRLSGGEARRLSLACTLVRHPALLVLDEPTYGQDRLGYEGLVEILRERLDEGACLIAATHDQRLVDDVVSRVIELADGRIARDRAVDVAA